MECVTGSWPADMPAKCRPHPSFHSSSTSKLCAGHGVWLNMTGLLDLCPPQGNFPGETSCVTLFFFSFPPCRAWSGNWPGKQIGWLAYQTKLDLTVRSDFKQIITCRIIYQWEICFLHHYLEFKFDTLRKKQIYLPQNKIQENMNRIGVRLMDGEKESIRFGTSIDFSGY
jgi:hypothetical protein